MWDGRTVRDGKCSRLVDQHNRSRRLPPSTRVTRRRISIRIAITSFRDFLTCTTIRVSEPTADVSSKSCISPRGQQRLPLPTNTISSDHGYYYRFLGCLILGRLLYSWHGSHALIASDFSFSARMNSHDVTAGRMVAGISASLDQHWDTIWDMAKTECFRRFFDFG